MKTNPYLPQDRVLDTFDMFKKYGYVLFPQQKAIYTNLGKWFRQQGVYARKLLEVGCGNGVGSALLYSHWYDPQVPKRYLATDVSESHIKFSKCFYPWMEFDIWDIREVFIKSYHPDFIVAVEVFEHLENPENVLRNLLVTSPRVWLSTPNGRGKENPPSNPHHCNEYTPEEMLELSLLVGARTVSIYDWKHLEPVTSDTKIDPLVYLIER